MKKNISALRPSFLLFVFGGFLLTAFRVVLKIKFTDAKTGFYTANSIMPLIFYISYAALLCAAAVLACTGKEMLENKPLPNFGAVSWSALVLGFSIEYKTLADIMMLYTRFTSSDKIKSATNTAVGLATIAFSAAAGIIMIILAIHMGAGAMRVYMGSVSLAVPVLYRCLVLVERFTGHTSSLAVSDDVLEILMLIFAILFMVGHSRVLTRIKVGLGHRLLEFAGYACGITTILLWVPRIVAIPFLQYELTSKNSATLLCDAALMLYAVLFTKRVTQTL
ncbi:MAG: hypothetical protein RSA45_07200 [Hydrogenoanaerobacterium sp.]